MKYMLAKFTSKSIRSRDKLPLLDHFRIHVTADIFTKEYLTTTTK